MIDAAHIDAVATKLLTVESRPFHGGPQRAPETREPHRLERPARNQSKQFEGALRARAEREQLGRFNERRQHRSARSHAVWCAASNRSRYGVPSRSYSWLSP